MSPIRYRRSAFAFLPASLAALAAAAPAQTLITTNGVIVAASGDPVPNSAGAPIPNTSFANTIDDCVLDESGNVYFRAQLFDAVTPVTPVNDRALFHGSTRATLRLVVRGGDQAPGLAPGILLRNQGGISTGLSGTVRISPSGRMWFGSSLSDGGITVDSTNDDGAFAGPLGGLTKILRDSDVAPGTGGARFVQAFSSPNAGSEGIDRNGVIFVRGSLQSGTGVPPVNTLPATNNQQGMWVGMPGALSLVVRKSDPVAGLGGAVASESAPLFIGHSSMNESGRMLIDLALSTTQGAPPATAANDRVLFVHQIGGGNQVLAREGDVAPGTAGGTFNSIAVSDTWTPTLSLNPWLRNDTAIFQSELRGGDVLIGGNDKAIFRGGVGSLSMVVRRGDPAPGTDAFFDGFHANCNHNVSGRVAFEGMLVAGTSLPSDDTGIWAGLPSSLVLVAREGQVMPGTGGSTCGSLFGANLYFNDLNQVLFHTILSGGTAPGASLWIWDAGSGLRPVILNGQQVEVLPAVFRVVSSLGLGNMHSNTDGAALSFGHDGTVALRINFTDGSRAIVRIPIPLGPPATPFCFGDGSGNACPCSPAPVPHGAPGKGCPTNVFPGGSQATASGAASISGDSLLLSATDMVNGSMIFYQGATQQSGGAGASFGDGKRCIQPTAIRRFKTKSVVGNAVSYPGPGDPLIHTAGLVVAPGTLHYQGWYRSANPTFCTAGTFNLTNGLTVTWVP